MLNLKKITVLSCAFALFLAAFASTAPVFAQENEPEHYATFRVLAEKTYVEGGEEIWVGVEQSIHPEWHTYWINPGDSGSTPRHDWDLPDGFQIENIQWPVPKKIPYAPLLNYGYSESVLLVQKLTIPDDLPEGPIKLVVDAEALVCKDICIPEYDTLELVLNDPDNMGEDNGAYFRQTLESIPEKINLEANYHVKDENFILEINTNNSNLANNSQNNLVYMPIDWGVVENAAPVDLTIAGNTIKVVQKIGERDPMSLSAIDGVLAFTDEEGNYRGVEFTAVPEGAPPVTSNETSNSSSDSISEKDKVAATGFLSALFFALIGGLILNLMPCVFPVLSLKALSLVKISEKDAGLARLHGISYTAGIVLSFLLIAGVLIALQAGGQQIGWGFQLQNPLVISLLAYLLFAIGLNLSGFFEISNGLGNTGNRLTQGQGLSSSFFTGVLATIVATPCTAPFMGVAIGYALLQPAYVSLSVFAALGLGLALPYLVLAFVPALQKSLPRPGAWMDVFKQFLAFPMFGFAAWLVWILAQQTGSFGVLGVLLGMILLAFAIWLWKVKPLTGKMRIVSITLAVISVLAMLAVTPVKSAPMDVSKGAPAADDLNYSKFSPSALDNALATDAPVFVEMTAAWCITCKVNHATSLNINSTKKAFKENNVKYLLGDWTNQDPEITEYLTEFGRNGVPIYVFYGAPDPQTNLRPEAVVLPQILTPAIVADAVSGKT